MSEITDCLCAFQFAIILAVLMAPIYDHRNENRAWIYAAFLVVENVFAFSVFGFDKARAVYNG